MILFQILIALVVFYFLPFSWIFMLSLVGFVIMILAFHHAYKEEQEDKEVFFEINGRYPTKKDLY